MTIGVDLQRAVRGRNIPGKKYFERWVGAALADHAGKTSVSLRVVGREEGRELNQRWRGRNYATNVLSFPCAGLDDILPGFLGDVVICADVVSEEAAAQSKDPEAHWAHLVVHGVLHLLGFDHEDVCDADVMEAREADILRTLGYADPYLEVETND